MSPVAAPLLSSTGGHHSPRTRRAIACQTTRTQRSSTSPTPSYLAYFKAIEYSDATTGSITFLIKPAIAPFIAMILLGEDLLWNSYVGLVLILAASLLNLFENRAQHRQQMMDQKRIRS